MIKFTINLDKISIQSSSHMLPIPLNPSISTPNPSDMSHHHHKDTYVVTAPAVVNPAALPDQIDGKEYKYERVETTKVDNDGTAILVDAREDRGKEDPGMNFQDVRPNVPPGTPIGVVPSAVSGVAPLQPVHAIPGPFLDRNDEFLDRERIVTTGGPGALRQETTTVTQERIVKPNYWGKNSTKSRCMQWWW